MKNISIWKDIKDKKYGVLNEDVETDVLIIGGGITGISTLYHLRDSKLNVMLVEQNKIGYSTTGNSTGKLSFLQNDLLDKIRNSFDEKSLGLYLNSQIDAINMIKSIIDKEHIDCDLESSKSCIYTNKDSEIDKVKDLERVLNKYKIKTNVIIPNYVKSKYAIEVSGTYLIHPIKLLYGLLKNNDYPIYENTSIKRIDKCDDGYLCHTDNHVIKAKKVVLASHYPYFIKPYLFPIKGYLEKSYISASKSNIGRTSLISYSNPFISARSYKDYLIYLSNSHSIDSKVDDEKNFSELLKKVSDLNLKPDYLWSNIDIITNDGLPYIGLLKDNMYIGTGYNTWGLTNGFLAGNIIADLIHNKKNEFESLFDPYRLNMSQVTGAFKDGIKSVKGYISGCVNSNVDGMINEHAVERICPHLGCKLLYNSVEKTWDCPCHGSRFDLSGKVISGPANRDITL